MFLPFQRGPSSAQVSLRLGAYPKIQNCWKVVPGSEVRPLLDRNDDIDDVGRRGQKSGPEERRGEGDEREKGRSCWITARWAHDVSIELATTEPQKTGCLRRNRLCVRKGNTRRELRQVPSHERAMSGQSVDMVWDPQTQTNSLEGWDYSIELAYLKSLKGSSSESNLQLAAELGKTLLERNKELENIIKLHQATEEEQTQEIEYMKKQIAALREVNNTRLKVYEQLEVSVQDLERANHHLVIENTSDKKLIKRWQRETGIDTFVQRAVPSSSKSSQETIEATAASDEEMTTLLTQLQDARNQRAREQKKASELSQQLTTLLQENSALEEQLTEWRNKAQDVKSLQDEISTLEEVRRGQLCGRCLRGMDTTTHDELSIMLDQEEYDDISMAESLISENQRDSELTVQDTCSKNEGTDELDSANPYRVLVEKYQALLEVQRHCQPRRKDATPATCMSLQEELEMSGEFNNFYPAASEAEVAAAPESIKTASRTKPESAGKKPFSATPTDFSEAETSSSGFSDETSNKATQTDGRPGSFLCSIADGEDCKFSIYDDNSPFESRFRKTPEYRQLFSEIFSVLKRAAEAKDEGEKLPLLDEPATSQTKYDASFQEDLQSEATDDNQSIMSSVVSSVVSEPVFRVQSVSPANPKDSKQSDKSSNTSANQQPAKDASCRLDYVSLNLRVRKKSSAKKNSVKKAQHNDRSTTPDVIPTTNPKFVPAKPNSGRRRFKPFNPAEHEHSGAWNGQHNVYPNRSRDKKLYGRGSNEQQQQQHNNYEYKDFKPSTASEEVARLKRLEMSYAEVLRTPNNKSRANNHHHYRRN
ncbi:Cerebellar degeneration-like protein 2 [Trachymyrmex septentrionalis]|uniref:Cerebellar degeneration-like protein 2 n=1 Tax=Trachymyrmex septentrionalis TaxID=34720 RepID=A0A195FL14_9HYME|nr:Cerebellar degeneration-like protein 2 [Trachymyrmex septentrionalis]